MSNDDVFRQMVHWFRLIALMRELYTHIGIYHLDSLIRNETSILIQDTSLTSGFLK